MMKNTDKRYEAPKAEIIVIEHQGVLCASGGGTGDTGAGITGMQTGGTHGW